MTTGPPLNIYPRYSHHAQYNSVITSQHKNKIPHKYPSPIYYHGSTINLIIRVCASEYHIHDHNWRVKYKSTYLLLEARPLATCDSRMYGTDVPGYWSALTIASGKWSVVSTTTVVSTGYIIRQTTTIYIAYHTVRPKPKIKLGDGRTSYIPIHHTPSGRLHALRAPQIFFSSSSTNRSNNVSKTINT